MTVTLDTNILIYASNEDDPQSSKGAMSNIDALLSRPHVRTGGEDDGFWQLFRATTSDHARGTDVSDAHLAALMRQQGVRIIYTRDRGFRRFPDVEPRDPFA